MLLLIAGVAMMLDTDFGRQVPCEVMHVGYDSYVDDECAERVDEIVNVRDCKGERDDGSGRPAGIVNWD